MQTFTRSGTFMHNKPKQMIIHHVTQVLPSIADMAKLRPLFDACKIGDFKIGGGHVY